MPCPKLTKRACPLSIAVIPAPHLPYLPHLAHRPLRFSPPHPTRSARPPHSLASTHSPCPPPRSLSPPLPAVYSTSPDLAPSPGFARVGGGAASSAPESKYAQEDSSSDEDEDEEDDFDDGEMLPVRTRKKIDPANRRNSVSAACIDPAALAAFDLAAHKGPAKSPEESARIARFVKKSILFKALDDEQVQVIVDSMKPMTFANGEDLIEQGDEGDHFYILDKGTCDCFVTPKGEDERKCVKKYVESDYFGDLALMYNAPRAATVTASSAVTVWALEQSVFKNVIVSTTVSKRSMYGDWLRTVPILATLEQAEVDKAADALNEERFEDGDCIIRQDTSGDKFYIVKTVRVMGVGG
jgi:cAMP-dependent protein kinase regulator